MERRNHPRVPLDAPFFINIRIGAGNPLSGMLVDLGRGGLQAAFPPQENGYNISNELLGDAVTVFGLPKVFDEDGIGRSGYVSWVSADRFGVRFLSLAALTDSELEELTHSL